MTKAKATPKTPAKADAPVAAKVEVVEVPITNATPTDEQFADGATLEKPDTEVVIVNDTAHEILPTPDAVANAIANATPTPEQIADGAPAVVPVVVIGSGVVVDEVEMHPVYGVPIGVPLTFAQSEKMNRIMRAAGVDMSPKTSAE